jgi:hypothetical protein
MRERPIQLEIMSTRKAAQMVRSGEIVIESSPYFQHEFDAMNETFFDGRLNAKVVQVNIPEIKHRSYYDPNTNTIVINIAHGTFEEQMAGLRHEMIHASGIKGHGADFAAQAKRTGAPIAQSSVGLVRMGTEGEQAEEYLFEGLKEKLQEGAGALKEKLQQVGSALKEKSSQAATKFGEKAKRQTKILGGKVKADFERRAEERSQENEARAEIRKEERLNAMRQKIRREERARAGAR